MSALDYDIAPNDRADDEWRAHRMAWSEPSLTHFAEFRMVRVDGVTG